jgi:hypothetical protein
VGDTLGDASGVLDLVDEGLLDVVWLILAVLEAAGDLDPEGARVREALLEFEGSLVLEAEGVDEACADTEEAGLSDGAGVLEGV